MGSTPSVGVVIVAAGSGSRLGHVRPKAFVPIEGRSILSWSIDSVRGMSEPCELVVVVPSDLVAEARATLEPLGVAAQVVAGGATRQLSVAAGLEALGEGVDVVLIHDAARAFTPPEVFDRVVAAVRETGGGVIPGLPVTDTVVAIEADGRVDGPVDRSRLSAVQTPQGFPKSVLREAHATAAADATDDTSVVRAAGHPVAIVPGDARSFKITTADDLVRAEDHIRRTTMAADVPALRTGIGVDVHAYDPAAPLWLAGLFWPDEPGLAGHSDGDAVAHAICDALLGAAGLGDIGSRFGTDDPALDGAHGDVFLTRTRALLAEAGYGVVNVSVQLIAATPRFAPRKAEADAALTALLGAPVSVSATTSDGLGFTGRAEGVQAIATALLTFQA